MAKDIYVVTHTQSRHHVEGLVGGWYDSELTELGLRQAAAVAARLADLVGSGPVQIFASDLLRASQTAEPIAARLGAPVTHRPDLRERSLGVAGGQPGSWLEARVVLPSRYGGDRLDSRDGIEGAESKREFATRLYRAMDQVIDDPCATQIVVTHGFALTFAIAAWIRMPLESAAWVNFASNGGGITHLREDDVYFNRAVLSLNDRTHLAGL